MDRYEVMAGKMAPLTDGAHRKWGFTGKVETRSYERLVDALISDGDSYELGEYENSEEALAAAEAFISTHGNEVNDEEDGIGSVIYWTVEVERRVEYKENEWLPCDESGRIDDGYGNEPDAIVAYFSSLEGSREERAFELAKNEYLAWLEHRTDRYTTVYGYMD